jgi:hypothetical protein
MQLEVPGTAVVSLVMSDACYPDISPVGICMNDNDKIDLDV